MKRSKKKQNKRKEAPAPVPEGVARKQSSAKSGGLWSPWLLAAGILLVGYGVLTDPGAILSLAGVPEPAAWSLRNPGWLKALWLILGLGGALLLASLRPKAAWARPSLGRLDRAFLLLLTVDLALCLLSPHPAASIPLLPFLAAAAGVYLTLRGIFAGHASAGATWLATACTACALASLAIALFLPGLWSKEVPLYLVRGIEATRDVAGTFANPNLTASFLLLGALVFLCWRGPWVTHRGRLAWYAAGGVTGATLIATLSRAAWLALAVAAACAWLSSRDEKRLPIRTWAAGSLALVIAALALSALLAPSKFASLGDPRSLGKRAAYWSAAWSSFKEAPLLGHGPGSYPRLWSARRPHDYRRIGLSPVTQTAHNVILQRLAETGLVGTATFAVFVAACALPLLRSAPALPGPARGLGWGCLAFLVHNLFSSTLYEPSTTLGFVAALALYGGALEGEKGEDEKEEEEKPARKGKGERPEIKNKEREERKEKRRRCLRVGVALYLLLFSLFFGRHCLANHHVHQAFLKRKIDPSGATAAARRALSAAPLALRPRYDLAGTLTLQGHFPEAFAHYLLVEGGLPFFDEVLSNRCLASLAAGEPSRCKALSGEALRRDSHNVGLIVAISKAKYRLGDLEGALIAARIASKLLPFDKNLAALVADLDGRLGKALSPRNPKKNP